MDPIGSAKFIGSRTGCKAQFLTKSLRSFQDIDNTPLGSARADRRSDSRVALSIWRKLRSVTMFAIAGFIAKFGKWEGRARRNCVQVREAKR